MALAHFSLVILSIFTSAHALPSMLEARQTFASLTTSQIDSFTPFTWFASTAYCQPSTTITWSCGTNCDNNPGFLPTASGGDGSDEQFWFVGFDPTLDTVIVAHEGTDPSEIVADLLDADFFLSSLDPTLFPGIPSSVEAHSGFQVSHALSAPSILSAVEQTLSAHNTNSVTLVGHSLGAALALLDAVFLPLHLPSNIEFKTVGFGLPRVGNQDFANYVDANVTQLTHINNEEDPVPILPGMFLGFHHPSGEVHIQDSGVWTICPGQDNPSTMCIVGDVPNIIDSDLSDHDGPYNGITMGC